MNFGYLPFESEFGLVMRDVDGDIDLTLIVMSTFE
jgi:hypothetical protein